MKTKIHLLICLAVVLFAGSAGARSRADYKKVISKEFQVNPDAQVQINNRFGKVHFMNWDKNMVSVEVTITVEANDQESADRKLSRISVDFTNTPEKVSAITRIDEGRGSTKGNFSIDYIIHLPITNHIDVTNKFGNIFINETQGKTRIDLGYGNLEARKLENSDNLLDIQFSEATVNWMKGAVLTLKYSDMEIDYAGSLRLNSKYSDLDAKKIIALNVSLEGGKIDMENSSAVDSRSKFSDISINRVDKSMNLDIQYGSCDIDEIPADFTSISIVNKFGNVSLGISPDAKYLLDAQLKFCDLEYPDENAKFSFRSTTPTENTYKGVIGGQENPTSRIMVKSEFGNVKLQ